MKKIDKLRHIDKVNQLFEVRFKDQNSNTKGFSKDFDEKVLETIPEMDAILTKYGLTEVLKSAMDFYKKENERMSYEIAKKLYQYASTR